MTAAHPLLEVAVVESNRDWMVRDAAARGGSVVRTPGLTWVLTPPPREEAMLAIDELSDEDAGERLDAVLEACRGSSVEQVGCWSLVPTRPADLGARLVARGFCWSWRASWMSRPLDGPLDPPAPPPGVRLGPVPPEPEQDVAELSCFAAATRRSSRRMAEARPTRVWHRAAWRDGQPVGQATVHLSEGGPAAGGLAVAGIHDVAVVEAERRRGIGRALTLDACHLARRLGCRFAVLNPTPVSERLYRGLGFVPLGWAQTWWIRGDTLRAGPPPPRQVAFAEAVGRGDLDGLRRAWSGAERPSLDAPLPNGEAPLALAAKAGQHAVAAWLVEHGATVHALTAWDLGWREVARRILEEYPERPATLEWPSLTLLHLAAERGDPALADFALAAGVDPDRRDDRFGGSALDWASYFGRVEIAERIRRRGR